MSDENGPPAPEPSPERLEIMCINVGRTIPEYCQGGLDLIGGGLSAEQFGYVRVDGGWLCPGCIKHRVAAALASMTEEERAALAQLQGRDSQRWIETPIEDPAMGEAARRAAARAELIRTVEAEGVAAHILALSEEIAALCGALGIALPRLRAAGMVPAAPGSVLGGLQQLADALRQSQRMLVRQDATNRAILDILCRFRPTEAPMFRAMVQTAADLAEQEATDPDKQKPKSPILQ